MAVVILFGIRRKKIFVEKRLLRIWPKIIRSEHAVQKMNPWLRIIIFCLVCFEHFLLGRLFKIEKQNKFSMLNCTCSKKEREREREREIFNAFISQSEINVVFGA